MPNYSFKCTSCDALVSLSYSINDSPKVGDVVSVDEEHRCACSSAEFLRVWGSVTPSFKLTFRRVSPL